MNETLVAIDHAKPGGDRTVGVQVCQVWRKVNAGALASMMGAERERLERLIEQQLEYQARQAVNVILRSVRYRRGLFRRQAREYLGDWDGRTPHRRLVNRLRAMRAGAKKNFPGRSN